MTSTSLQILCLVLLAVSTTNLVECFETRVTNSFWDVFRRFRLTTKDLEGTWEAEIKNADCATLVEGHESPVCRDDLPPDCAAEIPTGHEKYIFNDGTVEQSYIHIPDIKTVEDAKKAFPNCAKAEKYPTHFSSALKRSEIVTYNPITGHLRYHNVARPETTDCVVVLYHWDKDGVPYLQVHQIVGFKGTVEEVEKFGPNLRCTRPPEKCDVGFDTPRSMDIHLAFDNQFNLRCTSGPCKNKKVSSYFKT
eukprot:g7313.t1